MSDPAPKYEDVSHTLANLRNAMSTPQSMGRTLIDHVLTVAANQSERRGDAMVMPAEITVTPLKSRVRAGISSCFHLGVSIGGHEVVGGDFCYVVHEI